MSVSRRHVEALLGLALESVRGGCFQERMPTLLDALTRCVPARSSAVYIASPAGGAPDPRFMVFRNDSLDNLADYAEHYMRFDPMLGVIQGAEGRSALLSDFVTPRTFGRDPYTGEYLPRLGVRHILGVSQPASDGSLRLLLAIQRENGTRDFTLREREVVDLAARSFARAAKAAVLHERSTADATPARGGAVVFDGRCNLLRADPGTLALALEIESPGASGADVLELEVEATLARAELLERRERIFRLRSGSMLRAHLWKIASAEGPLVLVLLEPRPASRAERVCALAERFGLTPREREIAELVAMGLSNGEVAARLSIAPVTVACALTAIFRKSGAGSRAKLVAMLGAS
jgi:DNA-binding CsgD family transcriptional regulator